MLYFDNASTSWPKPEVVYQTHDFLFREGGSAGRGVHRSSLQAGRSIFQTRLLLSKFFGLPNRERIVFTKNITEALNIGLQGILKPEDHVLISSLEHHAVLRPLEYLKTKGITYNIVPTNTLGELDLSLVKAMIQPNTRLLCFAHASNVLGSILPIAELATLAKEHGCLFMVDAAQSGGVLPIHLQALEIDFLAFTGHKGLMGPQGVGGFYARPGLPLLPLIYGGTGSQASFLEQPSIWPEAMESGTQNVPAIGALGAALEYILQEGLDQIRTNEIALMRRLLAGLTSIPGIHILGPLDPALRVGLVSCTFENHSPEQIAFELDQSYQIITRSGLHCAPLAHQTAGTLQTGALRMSLHYFHTESDIDTLLSSLERIVLGR